MRSKLAFEKNNQCQCTFFDDKDNTCRIYDNRPFECQLYPFLLTNEHNKINVHVHLSCPHIQDHLSTDEFEKFRGELKTFFAKYIFVLFLQKCPRIYEKNCTKWSP